MGAKSQQLRSASGRLGGLIARGAKPEVILEARGAVATERIAEFIDDVLAESPKLTSTQCAQLARQLLRHSA